MEKLTGEDLRVAVSEEMPFAYEELGESPSLSALLSYMKSHLREANFASNTEELRNILLDYVESDINESIYKQMDQIDDKESFNEKYTVRNQRALKKLIRESIQGADEVIQLAREYILDQHSFNDYSVEKTNTEVSVTLWCGGGYYDDEDESEVRYKMNIEKLVELKDDVSAFEEYIDSCESYVDYEASGTEFYERAEQELNKHFNCTGAFLEPSIQMGEGRTFLFADDMSFEGSFDYQAGEDYIREGDFDSFLELCISSFTPVTDESLTEALAKEKSARSLGYAYTLKDIRSNAKKIAEETNKHEQRRQLKDLTSGCRVTIKEVDDLVKRLTTYSDALHKFVDSSRTDADAKALADTLKDLSI